MYYLKELEHWDRKKTAANVQQFLTNDFPIIMSRADKQITDITSPQLNSIPSHTNGNSQEKKVLDHINYVAVFLCVADTYAHMSNDGRKYREIIKLLCLYKLDRNTVSNRLGIDTSTLDKRKIGALCEFANRFEVQKKSHEHQVDWIPNFRVPK